MVDFAISYAQVRELRQVSGDLLRAGTRLSVIADELLRGSRDALLVARAVEGEGAAACGDNKLLVGLWIAHTILNLYEAKWQGGRWPTIGDVVLDRWHGYVNVDEPAEWAWAIAQRVLARQRDLTGGAVAMLSRADLERHGWPPRDDLLIREFRGPTGATFRFYRTWAPEWKDEEGA